MNARSWALHDRLIASTTSSVFINELFQFITDVGNIPCDSSVTQLQHALQSAALADVQGLGAASVTAALLHDLGHLLLDEHNDRENFLCKDLVHESVGAHFLKPFFPAAVTEPIRLHVAAKRYLCTKEPDYYDRLSSAARRSCELQGGQMSRAEQDRIEGSDYLPAAVALCRVDDGAKVARKLVPGIDSYAVVVESVLLPRC